MLKVVDYINSLFIYICIPFILTLIVVVFLFYASSFSIFLISYSGLRFILSVLGKNSLNLFLARTSYSMSWFRGNHLLAKRSFFSALIANFSRSSSFFHSFVSICSQHCLVGYQFPVDNFKSSQLYFLNRSRLFFA